MIHIREDYRYFTHLPGKESVIPLSKAVAKVYPCRIEVTAELTCLIELKVTGPIDGFSHLLNIEKGRVEVFGTAKEGYFHLFLTGKDGKIFLKLYRGNALLIEVDGRAVTMSKGEEISLLTTETMAMPERREKVSFGCYKKPLLENGIALESKLYCLSQLFPKTPLETLEPILIDLFSPKLEDPYYRGLPFQNNLSDKFSLFSSFFQKYRASILVEISDEIHLLRGKLPHAGRALGLICDGFMIDILWKKGKVIKMILHPTYDSKKKFIFPNNAESFRVKGHPKEKGKVFPAKELLSLEQGKALYIDRIQG